LNCVYDQFIKFYLLKHKHRKLTLVPQHSIGELETLFTKQKYNLKVCRLNIRMFHKANFSRFQHIKWLFYFYLINRFNGLLMKLKIIPKTFDFS